MSSLQRSSSAPLTVAGIASPQQQQQRTQLPRTKSHMHVEKYQPKLYLKPLTTGVPPPLASSSSEREDPFNLAGFFPPSDEKGGWRWLRGEPEQIVEGVEDADDDSSDDDDETPEEAIRREDKLGVLTLFSGSRTVTDSVQDLSGRREERLLSPYRLDPASDWDAVHADLTGRRRGMVFS